MLVIVSYGVINFVSGLGRKRVLSAKIKARRSQNILPQTVSIFQLTPSLQRQVTICDMIVVYKINHCNILQYLLFVYLVSSLIIVFVVPNYMFSNVFKL